MSGEHYRILATTFATAGVEGFLDGVFTVLCLTALYLFIRRSPNRSPKQRRCLWRCLARPMVLGSILLLMTILAHWVCIMIRVATTVRLISNGISPVDYLQDVSRPLTVSMSFLIVSSVAIADSLLIWRLWVVSNHSRLVIIFPLCTGVAFVVCAFRVCSFFAEGNQEQGVSIHSDGIVHLVQAGALLTLATNLYCSASLMIFIYKIQSMTIFGDKQRLKSILVIVIESAAIWSAWSVFVFINYNLESFLSLPTFDGCPAISGIAFMLINVRVGLGWDTTPSTFDNQISTGGGLPTFRVDISRGSSQRSTVTVLQWPKDLSRNSSVATRPYKAGFAEPGTPVSTINTVVAKSSMVSPRTPTFRIDEEDEKAQV